MKFIEIVKDTKIDFVGLRNKAFVVSAILCALGIFAFIMVSLGKANLSVDFTGGVQIHARFEQKVDIGALRGVLLAGGIKDVQIQEISGTKEFLIKTKASGSAEQDIQKTIDAIIKKEMGDKGFQILASNMVGATVGKALKRDALIAMVISFICIIIYIAWRFTLIFGLAATLATFHDVLSLLGVFYLFNMEMNILFITALLTIAGYSLTDTVVVFDRIRENMSKMKSKKDFADVINKSINSVLSRTLITSITTLLAVGAILFLGGKTLFDFSFALFIGVLIGTYSSVFVASPLVYLWRKKAR
ncbi:MAG TPA: protein translocase subunit SecF [Syntrophorhabdaceae bacterium]|nr:protein translocase subunit SecF [Syntrophorhabdaceae bacterium]HOL06233.1 protein translocase subunit SecF [Syntrophorhabdaceae bacterium]HON84616.1 protein translocase subunit SecF [Syntrophorhabdaceae bacterium]HOT41119.1 protein translocase subunit SecF [Syntrophorhabdaceae bacterium]HPC66178.1 protein translocase subunit SecF [Syntrophorhabdaceae bacterium]